MTKYEEYLKAIDHREWVAEFMEKLSDRVLDQAYMPCQNPKENYRYARHLWNEYKRLIICGEMEDQTSCMIDLIASFIWLLNCRYSEKRGEIALGVSEQDRGELVLKILGNGRKSVGERLMADIALFFKEKPFGWDMRTILPLIEKRMNKLYKGMPPEFVGQRARGRDWDVYYRRILNVLCLLFMRQYKLMEWKWQMEQEYNTDWIRDY